MIVKLQIDGTEYQSDILREHAGDSPKATLHIIYEDGVNNPVNSKFEFTLDNENSLQNLFLNTEPYNISNEGYVEIWEGQFTPPFGSPIITRKLFEGYIDKEQIPVDLRQKTIQMVAIGKEQYYAEKLSRYDISQIYHYVDVSFDVRQRGARTSTVRFPVANYNLIKDYVQQMFEDMGFATSDIIINFSNSIDLKYKYNANKFGDISQLKPVAKTRNYFSRGYSADFDSNQFDNFADAEERTESYNSFIKDFAKLCGCIYFYEYNSGKVFFINRDYDFTSDLGESVLTIDNLILDEIQPVRYKWAKNGLELKFDDITLLLKVNRTGVVPGGSLEIGFEGNNLTQAFNSSDGFYYVYSSNYDYKIGGVKANEALHVSNPISMKFNGELKDYIVPGTSGDEINTFLKTWVYNNYQYVLDRHREVQLTIDGVHPAPLRINWNGDIINVFDTEIDELSEITILRFEY